MTSVAAGRSLFPTSALERRGVAMEPGSRESSVRAARTARTPAWSAMKGGYPENLSYSTSLR
jgi:hypothetical protein